jgi:hypothetical protein
VHPSRRPLLQRNNAVENIRRGHYELGVDACSHRLRVAAAFDELADML